jgi:uncharacterized damage-inducible protein DinB
MNDVLLELVRHKTWATQKLIDLCRSLDAQMLETTEPGTYGTIRETLVHLVNADRSYYSGLTGEQVFEPLDMASTNLATIAERFATLAPRWEPLVSDGSLADKDVPRRDQVAKGMVLFAQSIHHADVHRAHILSILGAHHLAPPELDVWEYGYDVGHCWRRSV